MAGRPASTGVPPRSTRRVAPPPTSLPDADAPVLEAIPAAVAGSERSGIQVIDKAVELLEALKGSASGLPLAEIARRVRMNRSTAYRILSTLEANRLVMRDEHLRYRLGFRLFELGSTVKEQHVAYHAAAIAHMRRVAQQLGLTAFLGVRDGDRDGDRALFIEQAVFGDIHYVGYPAGTYLPLNLGAGPRILLAHCEPEEIERILHTALGRLTEMSLTDPNELRTELSSIRQTGVAITDGDITIGLAAVGAPVFDGRGEVIAAVSLSGLSQRLLGTDRPEIVDAVKKMAGDMSRELGWVGARRPATAP